jgi:hypothetical protein
VKRFHLLAAALLLGASLGSCVRFRYARREVQTPIPEGVTEALRPGEDTLGSCLERLGAPLYAWEVSDFTYALAYGWDEGRDWGFHVSAPVTDAAPASVDYDNVALDLHGVVLIFDHDDLLLRSDRGYLREIAPGLERRRPALVEDDG